MVCLLTVVLVAGVLHLKLPLTQSNWLLVVLVPLPSRDKMPEIHIQKKGLFCLVVLFHVCLAWYFGPV